MVINGLGFVGQRLYLFPDFFKNILTERLFGEGVTREDLNQYAIEKPLIGFLSMVQQNSLWISFFM
jgi:transposase